MELFGPCCIFLLDYGAVRTVLYLSIGLWSCSDRVVSFYWIMELFGPCCIFLLDYGAVPTVLYLSIGLWSCSDRVVFCFVHVFHFYRDYIKSMILTKQHKSCHHAKKKRTDIMYLCHVILFLFEYLLILVACLSTPIS